MTAVALSIVAIVTGVGWMALATLPRRGRPRPAPARDWQRSLIAQTPMILWSTDAELRITSCEGGGLADLGLTESRVVGSRLAERLADSATDGAALEAHRRALAGETVSYRFAAHRGHFYRGQVGPLRDADGTVVGTVGYAMDVTEQHAAEASRRESEERFRLLIDSTPIVFWTTDAELRFTASLGGGLAGLGLAPNEVVGSSVAEFLETEELPVMEAHRRALHGTPSTLEQEVAGKVFAVWVQPLRDIAGEVTGALGFALDITERRRAENVQSALLRVSEQASAGRDPGAFFASIHQIVGELMYAENFYVAIHDPETNLLSFPYFVDQVDPPPSPQPAERGLTSYVLRTGSPLFASDAELEELERRGELELSGSACVEWLGVPLASERGTFGVLVVQSYRPDRRFSEPDKDLLVFVSQHIASAIERRRAMEERERSVSLLEATLESTADGILVVDRNGRIVSWNRKFLEMWRIPPDLVRRGDDGEALDFVTRQLRDPQAFLDRVRELYDDQEAVSIDLIEFTDGRVLERFSQPQRVGQECIGRVWSFRDVTSQRAAEAALRQSEERYRTFVANSSEGIWRFEVEPPIPIAAPLDEKVALFLERARLAECNNVMAQMYGYSTAAELLAEHPTELPSRNDAERSRNLRDFLDGRYRQAAAESHELDRHGETRIFLNNAVGVIEDEHLVRVWGTQTDITERRRAEEALRASEKRFRALFEESTDAIYIATPNGRLLDINPAGVELFGYGSKQEMLTADLAREIYLDPLERQREVEALQTAGSVKDLELHLRRRDGAQLVILETATAVRDERGELSAFRCFLRDVTEQRRLAEQLRQAQKMEAVGRLAGGVAHDFNNLLTVITGYSDLVLARLAGDFPFRAEIEEIGKAGRRAADVTRQLLALSRRQAFSPIPVDLNRIAAELESLLRRLIGEDISLVTRLEDGLGLVFADPGQLEQVILNLVVNARDAMPAGGELVLATSSIALDAVGARRYLDLEPGSYVVLSVSDTGVGMDDEVRDHIFEPFFTTKERGRGTGLGLSTVYGIVKQSGGHIEVESSPARGSSFHVFLPRLGDQRDRTAGSQEVQQAPLLPASGRILLVEDEDAVRGFIATYLRNQGLTVVEAENGKAALDAYATLDEPIDVLLTDVVMPLMGGEELADELVAQRPDLKVVFMSGHMNDARQLLEPRDGARRPFLQKPFSAASLAAVLGGVLQSDGKG